jgi:hypothetical protein
MSPVSRYPTNLYTNFFEVNINYKELPIQLLATDVILNINQSKTVLIQKPTIKINVLEFQQHDGMLLWERRDNKPHPILHRKSAQSQQYPCCNCTASSPQKVPCLCPQIALEKKLLVDPLVTVLDLCMWRMPQSESLQAVPTPCLITRPHWLYE